MIRTKFGIGAVTVLAATLAVGGCKEKEAVSETKAPEPVVTVRPENVIVVALAEIRSGPVISGSLMPEHQATIRAEVGGAVKRMNIEVGQRVTHGQELGLLDDTAVRDAYLSAKSGLTTAESALQTTRRDAERITRLSEVGAVPERDRENAQLSVTNAEGMVADAQARFASAEQQLAKTRLRAPFNGTVSARPVNVGDVVQIGTPLLTVVDPSRLELEATVPAEQIGRLRIGMPVEFSVTGFTRRFTGRIDRINPVADPATRQVQIYATVPNADRTLVGGLFAEGRVATESKQALTVPASAVENRGITPMVRLLKDGRVAEAQVALGVRDEAAELIEIKSGIVEGDTVLFGTTQAVTPGVRVRVLQDEAKR